MMRTYKMKKGNIDKLKQEFSLKNPYFNIIGLLGTGNHGTAFALPEEKVLKLTSDHKRCLYATLSKVAIVNIFVILNL